MMIEKENEDLKQLKDKLIEQHGEEAFENLLRMARLERDFLDSITLFRRRMKITQKELADKTSTKSQQISKYERAEQIPSLTAILKICDALGIELMLKSKKDDEVLFHS